MTQTAHTELYGNLIAINSAKSGKVKFLTFAQASFSKDKPSKIYSITVFERDFDKIADLEARLAEVRKESGNAKAALKNVHIDVRLSMRRGDKEAGTFNSLQLVFYKIVDKKAASKATEAKTDAPAPAEAPADVATEEEVVAENAPF